MQAAVLYEPRQPMVIADPRLDPLRAGAVRVRAAATCCSWKRCMSQ
jgi:Zn-dependent alcohol dehydrogenase